MFNDYRKFLSVIAGLILVVIAIVFFKERAGFSDTPAYVVGMTCNKGFFIAHNRYVIIGCEWLPYLFLKAGMRLKAIALGYSLGHTLFPVILAAICLFVFRQPQKSLAIMLFWVIMSRELFYYPVSEFQMGMGLLLFYDSYLDNTINKPKSSNLFLLLSLIILPTIIFSHPIMILVFIAWVIYRVIKNNKPSKSIAGLIIVVAMISYAIKRLFFESGYEVTKMPSVTQVIEGLSKGVHYPLGTSFYEYIMAHEFIAPILFLITLFVLLLSKKFGIAAYLLLVVAGFVSLILLLFGAENNAYDHYFEHLLQPSIFFIVLILTDNLDNVVRSNILKLIVGLGVFIIAIVKIIDQGNVHIARQEWYLHKFRIMDQCGIRKAIVLRDELPSDMNKGSFWNSSYETMLLSSMEGSQKTKTIFLSWGTAEEQAIKDGDEHTVVFDGHNERIDTYPSKYYNLGKEKYSIIRNDQCIKR